MYARTNRHVAMETGFGDRARLAIYPTRSMLYVVLH
jgi:hypothetical protein